MASEAKDAGELVVVFGATGGTGKAVVDEALKAGYRVRAVCRTPSKVAARDNLEVVKGDVNDLDGVAKAIEGANYVVSVVWIKDKKGAAASRAAGTAYTQCLVDACKRAGAKKLIMQAVLLTRLPEDDDWSPRNGKFTCLSKCLPCCCYSCAGFTFAVGSDAAGILKKQTDVPWVLTRPGPLEDKPSRGTSTTLKKPGKHDGSPTSYCDLGKWTVTLLKDDSVNGTYAVPVYAKGGTDAV